VCVSLRDQVRQQRSAATVERVEEVRLNKIEISRLKYTSVPAGQQNGH
jgi:hypothetical protein